MADPITWGLITKVRSSLSALQTLVSGVGTKVDNIPTYLSTDFNAIKSAVNAVNTAVGNVNTAVASVKNDTNTLLPLKVDSGVEEIKELLQGLSVSVEGVQNSLPASVRKNKAVSVRNDNVPLGAQNVSIVDITGSGVLYYALVSSPYTWSDETSLKIEITIDDKKMIFTSNGITNRIYGIGYFAKEIILEGANSDNYITPSVFLEKFVMTLDSPTYMFHLPFSIYKLYEFTGTLTDNDASAVFSEYGLRFNNKLTVKVSNNNTEQSMRADASVYYMLD